MRLDQDRAASCDGRCKHRLEFCRRSHVMRLHAESGRESLEVGIAQMRADDATPLATVASPAVIVAAPPAAAPGSAGLAPGLGRRFGEVF